MNVLPVDQRRRYVTIIESIVAKRVAFVPTTETDSRVQIERASDVQDLSARLRTLAPNDFDVVDHAGHVRPLYRPMLVYHWLSEDETAPPLVVQAWREAFLPDIKAFGQTSNPVPASAGADAVVCAWKALVLELAASQHPSNDFPNNVFNRVKYSHRPDGSLLHATSSDNPETQWYHELILTHTLLLHAAQTGDLAALDVALANADFHQEQTQPDHATSQPWGLAAFILNPNTGPLADQVLHAMNVQHPRGIEGVSLLLLRDALYCLKSLS